MLLLLAACESGPTPGAASDRQATFTLVLNDVQSRDGEEADFAPASQGDVLAGGGQAQSGETGRARLDLAPDGTIVRMGPATLFTLEALEEEAASPVTRLRLFFGQVWIILSGGTLEIESDYGSAAVRGSMMSVTFDAQAGMVVTCLEGHCSLGNEAGSLELAGGQASSIRARGEAPSPPREMDEGEIRAWEEAVPEAQQVLHPGEAQQESAQAEGRLNTLPLQFTLSNSCSGEDAPNMVGDWRWHFERLADANGPALSETVIVPNGQIVSGTLPAGQYVVTDQASNGEVHGPQLVDSDRGGLQVELCPEGGGLPAPGNPPPGNPETTPTRYELINNCPEGTWHWRFSGPASLSLDIPAGATASGELLPVGTYSATDWMDGAPGTNSTPEIPAGGFITVRACPEQ
jgi:hypothetical protein